MFAFRLSLGAESLEDLDDVSRPKYVSHKADAHSGRAEWLFSAVAVFLTFRHIAVVPLSGSPSLIADSILQTFIATLMSVLPPSILTANWMLTKPDPTAARISKGSILIRALLTALAACFVSCMVLPFAMPRLLAASLPFRTMLLLKCLYGMAIGVAVTPFAVAAVLRGLGRGEVIKSTDLV